MQLQNLYIGLPEKIAFFIGQSYETVSILRQNSLTETIAKEIFNLQTCQLNKKIPISHSNFINIDE